MQQLFATRQASSPGWIGLPKFCGIPAPGSELARRTGLQHERMHFLWRPQLRDPNDEMALEVAVNGEADALVTFNVRDYGNVPGRFGVDLLLPRAAIGRIRL